MWILNKILKRFLGKRTEPAALAAAIAAILSVIADELKLPIGAEALQGLSIFLASLAVAFLGDRINRNGANHAKE